ncbi:hypothetical protein FNV43_RR19679 [Rhamnella rubrinervis]|uniref:PPIase cyclophilin-type domain-containing protein n=1 Tax=Rhamnella rubrinervis TaxID=2594499 RepID=A0A8K0DUI8_9ROSA|nr:hypothetical protein FNV43_RR19679 [Rhamnella rubrinervis]
MLQTPKSLQSYTNFLNAPHIQELPTSSSFPTTKQCCKFSRRELTIRSNSLLLLLFGSQSLNPFQTSNAQAEEQSSADTKTKEEQVENLNTAPSCTSKSLAKRAFLDISIDGQPVGRIIVGLYRNDAPVGVATFSDLASGAAGISYRRKEFVKIMPSYVQHGGVRSYGVDAEIAKRTEITTTVENLVKEWEKMEEKRGAGTKNLAGSVSIVVRDPSKPPPKLKSVARKGKLEIDQEEVGTAPRRRPIKIGPN